MTSNEAKNLKESIYSRLSSAEKEQVEKYLSELEQSSLVEVSFGRAERFECYLIGFIKAICVSGRITAQEMNAFIQHFVG